MDRFRSLSARLVVTVVTLVAVVSLLIVTVTTLALRAQLLDQLDAKVIDTAQRGPQPGGPGGPRGDDFGNQGPGTLQAVVNTPDPHGEIVGDRDNRNRSLTADELDSLSTVPPDGEVHAIDLSGLGSYRVVAVPRRGRPHRSVGCPPTTWTTPWAR